MEDKNFKPDTEMELVWSWFLSLMDQAKQIPQLSDSFDFNFGSQFWSTYIFGFIILLYN